MCLAHSLHSFHRQDGLRAFPFSFFGLYFGDYSTKVAVGDMKSVSVIVSRLNEMEVLYSLFTFFLSRLKKLRKKADRRHCVRLGNAMSEVPEKGKLEHPGNLDVAHKGQPFFEPTLCRRNLYGLKIVLLYIIATWDPVEIGK